MILRSEEDTVAAGAALSRVARAGDVITLSGPLGIGKTAFARGFIGVRMVPQDASGDIGPELPNHIGQGVAANRPSEFDRECAGSSDRAWVVRRRDPLRNAAA